MSSLDSPPIKKWFLRQIFVQRYTQLGNEVITFLNAHPELTPENVKLISMGDYLMDVYYFSETEIVS